MSKDGGMFFFPAISCSIIHIHFVKTKEVVSILDGPATACSTICISVVRLAMLSGLLLSIIISSVKSEMTAEY